MFGKKIKFDKKTWKFNISSMRALFLYEDEKGKDGSLKIEGVENRMYFAYCIMKASNMEEFNYTFDEFIQVIEDSGEMPKEFTGEEKK